MKKLFWVLVLGSVVASAQAQAYDVVANGGFETANLSGWQIFNQGASGGQGSWYANNGGNGTYSGLPTSPPAAGTWQAVADNSGRAAAILYQDIAVPPTTKAVLSFVLWLGNAAPGGGYVNGSSLNPSTTNQRVRVDVISTSTNLLVTSSGVLQLVYQTSASTPTIVTPTTITQDLTALAGQTVRLRVALVATNGGLIAGIDKVKLEVSSFYPQPGFGGLLALSGSSARWGDFDNDGRLETSFSGVDNGGIKTWQLLRWSIPLSTWQPYATLPGLTDGGTALADLDRDGDLDAGGVGATSTTAHAFLVNLNEGAGSFTGINQVGDEWFLEPGTHHGSLDWGDFDNDGDLDALMTGQRQLALFTEGPSTVVGFNDGLGQFGPTHPALAPVANGNALWADMAGTGQLGVGLCGSNVTELYSNDGDMTLFNLMAGLPGVTNGAIAMGDLTNDGFLEYIVTGMSSGSPIAKVFSGYPVFELPAGLTGVSESSVSLGDCDNDGWLDIALCGNTGASRITRVYHNNGNGTFTDIGASLPGVSAGSVEFGDWEGDGDLDLLLQGDTGAGRIGQVYLNSTPTPNAAPTPPAGLLAFWLTQAGPTIAISAGGTDDHTAHLTANFRAGTSPGAIDVIAPMSNLVTGRRLVPREGESHQAIERHLPLTGIGHGSLYWSAQCVDQSYRGSVWAPEQTLTTGPYIALVQDVPQDQGGRVRLLLYRSILDNESRTAYPAAGYNVWRLVPSGPMTQTIAREAVTLSPAQATARLLGDRGREASTQAVARIGSASEEATDLPLVEWQGRHFFRSVERTSANPFPAGTWEIVGSFYATQQSDYLVLAPTLADSGSSGEHDVSFIVTVHTTTPSVWFASLPTTGHSVDNLAPGAPVGLIANYHTGSGNHLAWQAAPEHDFAEFHVYRGTTPGFPVGPATLVASPTSPDWNDPGYDAPTVYYRVSTLDHAGNESAAVAPGGVTAGPDASLPAAFALGRPSPNPFTGSTIMGFALPTAAPVRLEVFDTAGRLVCTVLDAVFPPGEHQAVWNGADQQGRSVQSGLYFYRLRAGSFTATRRVTCLTR